MSTRKRTGDDLKEIFLERAATRKQARARMVTCDYCGSDGYKVWPNEPCPRCNQITVAAK